MIIKCNQIHSWVYFSPQGHIELDSLSRISLKRWMTSQVGNGMNEGDKLHMLASIAFALQLRK